jgi:hypothetical protein
LKKEIKKLQRFRDQVKQWAASNDVKDKNPLLEARRRIEVEMERFKVIEKETKTKAFSKEGLAAARVAKDPKEKAKDEAKEWMMNAIEEMNTQIETFEGEIDSLTSSSRKKSSKTGSGNSRLTHLEESMSRHHQHIARLELCSRLVDDDALEPSDAEDLKDLVEDYLERNQEDFDEFAEVEDIYADLDLDELEDVAARNKANSVNIAAELALAAAKADSTSAKTEGGEGDERGQKRTRARAGVVGGEGGEGAARRGGQEAHPGARRQGGRACWRRGTARAARAEARRRRSRRRRQGYSRPQGRDRGVKRGLGRGERRVLGRARRRERGRPPERLAAAAELVVPAERRRRDGIGRGISVYGASDPPRYSRSRLEQVPPPRARARAAGHGARRHTRFAEHAARRGRFPGWRVNLARRQGLARASDVPQEREREPLALVRN